jgi:RND family efflux transporter MFP subunit
VFAIPVATEPDFLKRIGTMKVSIPLNNRQLFFAALLYAIIVSVTPTFGQTPDYGQLPQSSEAEAETESVCEGFTEPIRKIDLASDEVGSIFELSVEEGQTIAKGDTVAKLDSRIQRVQLDIATQLAGNRSQLEAVAKEHKKRAEILDKLVELRSQGHASHSEVVRGEMELAISKSKLETTQAEIDVRELERQRAEVQLQRRTITAPFDGVVTKIHTREGEYLSPMNPNVLTLAQMDQLVIKFNVPTSKVSSFAVGQVYNVELSNGRTVMATVQQIGVEIDAESETVEIKFVIDNSKREFLSGEKAALAI